MNPILKALLKIFGIPVSFDKKNKICKISGLEAPQTFYGPPNLEEISWFANFNQWYLHSRWSDLHKIGIKIFRKERPFKWHQTWCCL